MSECSGGCECSEAKAKKLLELLGLTGLSKREPGLISALAGDISAAQGVCPQACGKSWPECGCPTAGMKDAVMMLSNAAQTGQRVRRRRGKEGIAAMMTRLGGKIA